MKLDYLTTLQAVIRHGSFAAAAARTHLTPSAVSQRMQQLERWFGRPLFDRSLREVRPNGFALEVAATVVDALDGLEALREKRVTTVSGRVRIGALTSVQISVLPQCLAHLRARQPTLEVEVRTDSSQALIAQLRAGEIDAAIVVRPATEARDCLWLPLRRESFALVVPAGAAETTVRRAAQAMPWIRYNMASRSGQLASRFVRAQAPGIRPMLDVTAAYVIVAMVAVGLGFSVMPQVPTALLRAFGAHQAPLDRLLAPRQIVLVQRVADRGDRRIESVLDSIREAYESDARRPSPLA